MKLTDIIALAKAGYTAAEVKELMAQDIQEQTVTPDMPAKPAEEPAEQLPQGAEKPSQENEPGAEAPDAVHDDKALEEMQKKIIDLESKLAQAQKVNVTQTDLSGNTAGKTDQDLMNDLMRQFM